MRYGIIALLLLVFTSPALAKNHHHHHRHYHYHHRHHANVNAEQVAHNADSSRPGDCRGIPWCGCWLRHHLGVGNKDLNRAIEWRHYGHPSVAHVGAIVVWSHHVGIISGGHPGDWIVTSGNDGHAVRSRRRSLNGVVAIRE